MLHSALSHHLPYVKTKKKSVLTDFGILIMDCMYTSVFGSEWLLKCREFHLSNVKRNIKFLFSRKPQPLKFYLRSVCGSSLSHASNIPSLSIQGLFRVSWGLPVYLVSWLELIKEQIWQAKLGGCVGI